MLCTYKDYSHTRKLSLNKGYLLLPLPPSSLGSLLSLTFLMKPLCWKVYEGVGKCKEVYGGVEIRREVYGGIWRCREVYGVVWRGMEV